MHNLGKLGVTGKPGRAHSFTRDAPLSKPPSFEVEERFWRAGLPLVAGVDEVGRGALAGPLVAAAVVFPPCRRSGPRGVCAQLMGVRDSKLVQPAERVRLLQIIENSAVDIGVGVVSALELDDFGLAAANRIAMERAVALLTVPVDALVLDAFVLDLSIPQVGIIDADAKCLSVAAASIVAKVARDWMMVECHTSDPRYGFHRHKGYGVPSHLAALSTYGPGPAHRRSFAPVAHSLLFAR